MSEQVSEGARVWFPRLLQASTLAFAPVALLSCAAAALCLLLSLPVVAALAMLPLVVMLLCDVVRSVRNAASRRSWAASFSSRVHPRDLPALLGDGPSRYIVHVRYYGGFDATKSPPACVLETLDGGELAAIFPATWLVTSEAEKHGVKLVRHGADAAARRSVHLG